MDKFRTDLLGGLPFVLDDIRQFLGRLTSPANHGIYQAFNNMLGGFGTDFIVQGCVVSGSTGAFSITEGWILLSSELIKVDAQGPFDEAVDGTFTKVTTFDPRGNKDFLNGSTADTYEKNRGVISGLGGTLAFNANTFFDLSNQASSLPDTGVKILNKKIIEIGDWNMDTTASILVGTGITDFLNIRTVDAMIISDDSAFLTPIDIFTSGNNQSEGGIGALFSNFITLVRRSGGFFESTAYNATSFNRGFITIEFET